MRWVLKDKIILVEGQTNIVKRFLFFPKWIGKEIRWLESVTIKRTVINEHYYISDRTRYRLIWRDTEFID